MDQPNNVLGQLMRTIEDRREQMPPKSYTTTLFDKGVSKIGEKVMEEAGELVEAAHEQGDDAERKAHVVHEAADLLYHMLVLLAQQQVTLSDVEQELARRFGVSGLEEKASRAKKPGT